MINFAMLLELITLYKLNSFWVWIIQICAPVEIIDMPALTHLFGLAPCPTHLVIGLGFGCMIFVGYIDSLCKPNHFN